MTTCNTTNAARTSQEDQNSMVEADLRKREDDLKREKDLLQRREEQFVRTKTQYDLRLDLLVDLVLEGGPATSSREWSGWRNAEESARHLNEQRAADEAVAPSGSGLFLPLQEARNKIGTEGESKAATMAEAIVKLLVANLGVSTVPVQALSEDMQTTLRAKIEAHTGKVGMDSWKEGCLVSKANKRDALVNRYDGTDKDGVHACSDCVRRKLPCIWQTREALTLLPLPEKDRTKGAAAGDAGWYWQ